MNLRMLPLLLIPVLPTVQAADLTDPLATESSLPRVEQAPCVRLAPDRPLQALDAVDLALCNHPQTREMWAAARQQAALAGVEQAAYLPSLAGRLGVTRNYVDGPEIDQRSAAVTLSLLLFDSGQRSARLDSARQTLEAALATQDATAQSLFLAALQAFYNAQATRAAVLAAVDAERAAKESLAAAELRYKVGVAAPADRLQAQTAASQATLERIRAEGEAANSLGVLADALGFPAQTALPLADLPEAPMAASFAQKIDALIADALQRRPDLKALEAQFRAARAAVAAAQAAGRPSLSLAAGPTWQRQNGLNNEGGSIGLMLNVPLFSGFETTYRVRAAEAQAEVRAAQRDRLRNQVALDVWQAYQRLATATQTLQATQDLLASATQSEQVALGRYKAGVGSVLDLLSAQSALATARVQRIRATLDWNVYRATLARAIGTLDYTLLGAAKEQR